MRGSAPSPLLKTFLKTHLCRTVARSHQPEIAKYNLAFLPCERERERTSAPAPEAHAPWFISKLIQGYQESRMQEINGTLIIGVCWHKAQRNLLQRPQSPSRPASAAAALKINRQLCSQMRIPRRMAEIEARHLHTHALARSLRRRCVF